MNSLYHFPSARLKKRMMRTVRMISRKFEIRRMLKKLNQSAWRVRIELSTIIDRIRTPHRSALDRERQSGPPQTSTDAVADAAPTVTISTCPAPPSDIEPTSTNIQKPNLLPAIQYDAPEEKTFAPFAQFPAEIRAIIWQFASSEARVIEVAWISRIAGFTLRSSPRLPAVTKVCHEARNEALRLHKPYFRRGDMPRFSILINPASDIIFFRRETQSHEWNKGNTPWRHELGHVRRIAFTQNGSNTLLFVKKTVCAFPKLDEVVVLWGTDPTEKPRRAKGSRDVEQETVDMWYRAWRWRNDIVAKSNAEGWWAKTGHRPPAITVRRWCDEGVSES